MRRFLTVLLFLTLLPVVAGVLWNTFTGEPLTWTSIAAARWTSALQIDAPDAEANSAARALHPSTDLVLPPSDIEKVLYRTRRESSSSKAAAHLKFAARRYRGSPWQPLVLYAAAERALEAGDSEEAAEILRDRVLRESHLGTAALLLEARLHRSEEDLEGAARVLREAGAGTVGDPLNVEARRQLVRILLELGDGEEALQILDSVEASAPVLIREDEVLFLRAQAYQLLGKTATAQETLDSLYLSHPRSKFNKEANALAWRKRYIKSARKKRISPELRVQRADAFFEAGWYVSAHKEYQSALKSVAALEDPDRVYLRAGISAFRRKRYTSALAHLDKVGPRFREHLLEARFTKGQILRRRKKTGEFLREMDRVTKMDGTGVWRAKAQLETGKHFEDRDPAKAKEAYLLAAEANPGSEDSSEAAWRLGLLSYRGFDFDTARTAFLWLAEDGHHPHERATGLYWAAKSESARGSEQAGSPLLERVVEEFPNDYYATRARQLLGRRIDDTPVCLVPEQPGTHLIGELENLARRLLPNSELHDGLLRFRDFHAMGSWERAEAELDWLAANLGTLAEIEGLRLDLYGRKGDHLAALRAFRKTYPEFRSRLDIPVSHWRAVYPREFVDLVGREAEAKDLDVDFVFSVIHQESVFNPRATSHVGARGLMQIMPSTGKALARRLDEAHTGPAELYDPDRNVRYGTFYLRDLLNRFDGRPELALAGYNAGGGRVKRWLKEPGSDDLDLFVESIPFDETRNYVKRILNNVALYKRLYGAPQVDTGVQIAKGGLE